MEFGRNGHLYSASCSQNGGNCNLYWILFGSENITLGCSNIVQIQTECELHSHGNILRVRMNEHMSMLMLILILCAVLGDVRHNMKTSLLCLDLFVISLFVMWCDSATSVQALYSARNLCDKDNCCVAKNASHSQYKHHYCPYWKPSLIVILFLGKQGTTSRKEGKKDHDSGVSRPLYNSSGRVCNFGMYKTKGMYIKKKIL